MEVQRVVHTPFFPLRKHAEGQENNGQMGPHARARQCLAEKTSKSGRKHDGQTRPCDSTGHGQGGGGYIAANLDSVRAPGPACRVAGP